MTREEAYKFLAEEASNTENGPMVHISCVEKAINSVSDDEELREKALDGIYECEGNSFDWMQLDDAKYFIDIALSDLDKDIKEFVAWMDYFGLKAQKGE